VNETRKDAITVSKRVLNFYENIPIVLQEALFLKDTNISFYFENLNDYKIIESRAICTPFSGLKNPDYDQSDTFQNNLISEIEGQLQIESRRTKKWKSKRFKLTKDYLIYSKNYLGKIFTKP
jgi:hypothetical protein